MRLTLCTLKTVAGNRRSSSSEAKLEYGCRSAATLTLIEKKVLCAHKDLLDKICPLFPSPLDHHRHYTTQPLFDHEYNSPLQ